MLANFDHQLDEVQTDLMAITLPLIRARVPTLTCDDDHLTNNEDIDPLPQLRPARAWQTRSTFSL